MTGGRLLRVLGYLGDEDFCFTYGDGLADIDITALVAFHHNQGKLATITAVQPPGRFGALQIDGERVLDFREKPPGDGNWVNGGFFVLSPQVKRYLTDDTTVWENEPVHRLARDGQLACYRHGGFWQAMDTLRDQLRLEDLWKSGGAPWKTWT